MTAQKKHSKPPGHADPDQFERFRKVAEEVGASDDPGEFDRAFEKVTDAKSREERGTGSS